MTRRQMQTIKFSEGLLESILNGKKLNSTLRNQLKRYFVKIDTPVDLADRCLSDIKEQVYEATSEVIAKDKLLRWKNYISKAVTPRSVEEYPQNFVGKCWIDAPIRAALQAMRSLSRGYSPALAEQEFESFGFDGIVGSHAVNIVSYFSSRGTEFKDYFNKVS